MISTFLNLSHIPCLTYTLNWEFFVLLDQKGVGNSQFFIMTVTVQEIIAGTLFYQNQQFFIRTSKILLRLGYFFNCSKQ